MVCRIGRWATNANAPLYHQLARATVIPGIEAQAIAGTRSIDRREQRPTA